VGDSGHRCWVKQQGMTLRIFSERISLEAWDEIVALVQQANLGLNMTLPGNECPYNPMYCKGLPYAMPRPDRQF
jgi:hypothetical protein